MLVTTAAEPEEAECVVGAVACLLHDGEQRAGGVTDADPPRVGPARQHLVDGEGADVGDDVGRERVAVVRRVALPDRRRIDGDDDEAAVDEVARHAEVPELRRRLEIEVPARHAPAR